MIDREKLEKAICKNVCFTRCTKRLWVSCEEKGSGNCSFAKYAGNWQSGFAAGAEWAEKELSEKLREWQGKALYHEERTQILSDELAEPGKSSAG